MLHVRSGQSNNYTLIMMATSLYTNLSETVEIIYKSVYFKTAVPADLT